MSEDSMDLIYYNLCCYYSAENEEELRNIINRVKDLNRPENLQNQNINIDLENLEDSEIMLSDGPTDIPSGFDHNVIVINLNTEKNLFHVHLYSRPDVITKHLDYFAEILDIFGGTSPNNFNLYYVFPDKVDELGIGKSPEETRMSGIRFYKDENEYVFHESEEEGTIALCKIDEKDNFTSTELHDIVRRTTSSTSEYLNKIIHD